MGVTTIIRHRGGNQQVFFNNGQRWHLKAGQSVKEIPAKDSVGDQMQAAVRRVVKDWGPDKFTQDQLTAVECFAKAPVPTVALTDSATTIAKKRGTTPEAIKAVLETMDGVFY